MSKNRREGNRPTATLLIVRLDLSNARLLCSSRGETEEVRSSKEDSGGDHVRGPAGELSMRDAQKLARRWSCILRAGNWLVDLPNVLLVILASTPPRLERLNRLKTSP